MSKGVGKFIYLLNRLFFLILATSLHFFYRCSHHFNNIYLKVEKSGRKWYEMSLIVLGLSLRNCVKTEHGILHRRI